MRKLALLLSIPLALSACGDKDDDSGATDGTDGTSADGADGSSDGADGTTTDGGDGADGTSDGADGTADGADGTADGTDGTADGTDGTEPEPVNMLLNPGFEQAQDLTDWLIFPGDLANWAVLANGDAMYPDDTPFAAHEGSNGLKLYGQYSGWENETPVYQEFPATPGEVYTFDGWGLMHGPDAIVGPQTYAALWIKFYDDSYAYYGAEESVVTFTEGSAVGTWTEMTVTATVPEGATKVQAAIEFWHCTGEAEGDCYEPGGVYFDQMRMYLHDSSTGAE
jgi:hypothetical protein